MRDHATSSLEKTIVIGWDGATWDLLLPWVQSNKLPNLAQLMAKGVHATLRSTPLPLSPSAWTSLITGVNPAKHGIFDWFERQDGSYRVTYVSTAKIGAKPLWQYFNEQGKRVGLMGVPMIYPAVPLHGFMISGMAAPHARVPQFTYPTNLIEELVSRFGPYPVVEGEIFRRGHEEVYLQSLMEWLSHQKRLVTYLIENYPCELYLFVFMQSDHVQHKFWRYLTSDPRHDAERDAPWNDAIYRVYQSLDEALGEWMRCFGETTHIVLLSDHGAGPSYGVMNINHWLHREGYINLHRNLLTRAKRWMARHEVFPRLAGWLTKAGWGNLIRWISKPMRNRLMSSLLSFDDVDWSRTYAYARGAFGQIYINLKGREPKGIVEPGEPYEKLVEEIIAKLQLLRHPETGDVLITDIHRKGEVMHGPYLERAADILFSIQHYSYQTSIKFDVEGDQILSPSEYEDSGGHRPEGIFVMAGPRIRGGVQLGEVDVTDILPTLLALNDLPISDNLDGRPLYEALLSTPKVKSDVIPSFDEMKAEWNEGVSSPDLDSSDQAQLEERLRNLGYLG